MDVRSHGPSAAPGPRAGSTEKVDGIAGNEVTSSNAEEFTDHDVLVDSDVLPAAQWPCAGSTDMPEGFASNEALGEQCDDGSVEISIQVSSELAGPGRATAFPLSVRRGDDLHAVCRGIAGIVNKPAVDLAFRLWHLGVGPGPRVRDFSEAVDHLLSIDATILVSSRRAFLVSRARKAPRSSWGRFAKEHNEGVLDPDRYTTEVLEIFDELAWP